MFKKIVFSLFLFFSMSLVFSQSAINQLDENGKRHGIWKKLHQNGNIRYQGKFEHGKEIGIFKFYAITGETHPIVIREFKAENTIADVRYFSDQGVLTSQGKMDAKHRIDTWIYYFGDAKTVLSIEHYKDGLLEGEVKIFYKTGKLTEISHYKAGKLYGNRIRYSDTGVVTENLTYKNGIIHGAAVIYDEKGEVFAKGNYENGKKTGIWEFNMDGEMVKSTPDKIKKK